MKARFDGQDGQRCLVTALQQQRIIEHDKQLATAVASAGTLVEYSPGDTLIEQGAQDNHVLFIVSGEVDIYVNSRKVARRVPNDSVGEMAMIDSAATRSATVIATKPTVALNVAEAPFQSILARFPQMWRPIAQVLASRLRERERFHRPPNPIPILFLGSSVEGLQVANEIVSGLKHDNILPRPWSTPGLFSPGGVTVDELLKEVDAADFAAFVFGPDDKLASRRVKYFTPRDNVVFELGLFMGQLDRERAVIVKEHLADIKIPTDLLGISPISYVTKSGQSLADSVATVCNDLRTLITKLGPR